jgi:hypothetical protein
MKRIAPVLALALAALGCIEREEEYTLNPDSSGKVKVSWVGAPYEYAFRGLDDAEETMKKIVRVQLSAPGIDCWKDVDYSLKADGKIAFRGTAYFKKLADVNFAGRDRNPMMLTYSLEKDDKGNLVLSATNFPSPAAGAKPSEEEAAKTMKKVRMKYQMVRPMIRAALAEYRTKAAFKLPGAADEVRGFVSAGGAVRLDLDGPALAKVCEELYLGDEALRKAVDAGADIDIPNNPRLPSEIAERLFKAKELRATTKGELKAAFDYDAEVTDAAREAFKKLVDSLPKDDRFGGMPAAEEEDSAPAQSLEEVLKEALLLDLNADVPFKSVLAPDTLRAQLNRALNRHGGSFRYQISLPTYSMSGGGSDDKVLTLKVGDGSVVENFEYRQGPELVTIRQGAKGAFRITIEEDASGLGTIFTRGSAGVQLFRMGEGEGTFRKWASFDLAARSEPAVLGMLLARLRPAPLRIKPTAADAAVADLATRWADRLDDATRGKLDEIRKRLLDEGLEERTKAVADLAKETGTDVLRLRHVADWIEGLKENADAKARVQGVLDLQADVVASIALVRDAELHRDLAYLGALLDDGARKEAAKARLKALTGRDFNARAELETWHAANKDKLKWDAPAGKYLIR